jgi:hypothetical protein
MNQCKLCSEPHEGWMMIVCPEMVDQRSDDDQIRCGGGGGVVAIESEMVDR